MSDQQTRDAELLDSLFMGVHSDINTALDLLSVIEDELSADHTRAGSLAEALAVVLRRAGWANQRACNAARPGLLDAANIADWVAPSLVLLDR